MSELEVGRPDDVDGIVTLTLNRPSRANSLSTDLVRELLDTLTRLRHDPECRGLVITGAGSTFCGCADMKERGRSQDYFRLLGRMMSDLQSMPVPTVAAINGACRGGGTELAISCDFRMIADGADVGLPEIVFGSLPAAGGTQRLPRLIGTSRAKQMILTGEPVDAARCVASGLADLSVPADGLLREARDLAGRIARNPRTAVETGKFLADMAWEVPLDRGLALESAVIARMSTADERAALRSRAAEGNEVYRRIFAPTAGE
jgi:enoyl-CoA hydratase/carnithine racemase